MASVNVAIVAPFGNGCADKHPRRCTRGTSSFGKWLFGSNGTGGGGVDLRIERYSSGERYMRKFNAGDIRYGRGRPCER